VFANEDLTWLREGEQLSYLLPKPLPDGCQVLHLTPLELLEEGELDAPTGRVADYIPDLRLATRECGRLGDLHLLHRWISGISRSVR